MSKRLRGAILGAVVVSLLLLFTAAGALTRVPVYLNESVDGKLQEQLTDSEVVDLTPELADSRIAVVEADAEDLGALQAAYEQELETLLPTKAVDELIENTDQGWSTYRSVLEEVNTTLGGTYDLDNNGSVNRLVRDFEDLTIQGQVVYGVWGPDTFEGKIKTRVGQGVSYKIAKAGVLVEDGVDGVVALNLVDAELLYDEGHLNWGQTLKLRRMAEAQVFSQTDFGQIVTSVRAGKKLKDVIESTLVE